MLRSWLEKKGSAEKQAKEKAGGGEGAFGLPFLRSKPPAEDISPWLVAAYKVSRIGVYGTSLIVFWLLLGSTGLLPENFYSMICLVFAVIAFVLAIPLSILIRLDELPQSLGLTEPGTAALFCFAVAVLNLYILALVKPLFRWIFRKEASVEVPPENPRIKPPNAGARR